MGNKVLYYSPTITFHWPWLYEWIKQNEIQFYFGLDLDPDPDFFFMINFMHILNFMKIHPGVFIDVCILNWSQNPDPWPKRYSIHPVMSKLCAWIHAHKKSMHDSLTYIGKKCTTTNFGMNRDDCILDLSVCSFRSVGVKWMYSIF